MLGTITEHSEAILARGLAVFLIPSCLSAVGRASTLFGPGGVVRQD